jgi:hypothetical protein
MGGEHRLLERLGLPIESLVVGCCGLGGSLELGGRARGRDRVGARSETQLARARSPGRGFRERAPPRDDLHAGRGAARPSLAPMLVARR